MGEGGQVARIGHGMKAKTKPTHNLLRAIRERRSSSTGFLVMVTIGLTAIVTSLVSARAQEAGPQPLWQARVTPYLWLPWTSTDIHPSNNRIPSASGTVDPGLLVSHLTWVPFMGEIEFRNGPVGVLIDFLHAPLKAGVTTRNIVFSGGGSGLTLDTGTVMLLYRPLADPIQYLDVGMGLRAWGLDGTISLNQGLLPAVAVSNGLSWADPLIAARYHRELGNGFSATAYADVGGAGLGAHIDWQMIGTIDYAVTPSIDAHAGFRSLNFNYAGPRAGFNVNMYGPIISATLRF